MASIPTPGADTMAPSVFNNSAALFQIPSRQLRGIRTEPARVSMLTDKLEAGVRSLSKHV